MSERSNYMWPYEKTDQELDISGNTGTIPK